MKIKPYVEKLEKSGEYKSFRAKYPDAFVVAGFFILDFDTGQNVHQIDFYVPSEKKIAAFTLDEEVRMQLLDMISKDSKMPEKLDIQTNVDLDALQGILTDEMHNRGISEDIRKIIAVIQNVGGKKIWNLNCVLTGMEILKSHVEDDSRTVLKLEKTSLMDIMKHMPTQSMIRPPETQDEIKGKMENIEKLQRELGREKEKLKKALAKKGKIAKKVL